MLNAVLMVPYHHILSGNIASYPPMHNMLFSDVAKMELGSAEQKIDEFCRAAILEMTSFSLTEGAGTLYSFIRVVWYAA